jgi:REP element-mobilizing transposase RayT
MITNKKHKQLLKEQEERLRKEYEEECNEYRATICKLEEYIHDLEDIQLKADLEENLKHYDYAILVKDFKTLLWNYGRWEKFRDITFSHYVEEIPELNIRK